MTFLELQTLVLSWLDDPLAAYFTLPQVKVWLNNAQREAQKQLLQAGENWYVTKVSTSTVTDMESYTLPDDFLKLHKLEFVVSGTGVNEVRQMITPVTLTQLDQVSMTTGQPAVYCLKKDCIILRPIPDQIYTLYMFQSGRVTDMVADGDEPDVPPQYHEYLAILAALDGFLKDQRDPSPFMAKKDGYLAMMKQDENNRTVDVPRMVRETDCWDGGFLF